MKYVAGDHLAIFPENPRSVVTAVMARLGIHDDASCILRPRSTGSTRSRKSSHREPTAVPTTTTSSSSSSSTTTLPLPLNTAVRVTELLSTFYDLCGTPSTKQLLHLADLAADAGEANRLRDFAWNQTDNEKAIVHPMTTVVDLLVQYPSVKISLEQLLSILPLMKPRFYSISSSPSEDSPSLCSITVGIVSHERSYSPTVFHPLLPLQQAGGEEAAAGTADHSAGRAADADSTTTTTAKGGGADGEEGSLLEDLKHLSPELYRMTVKEKEGKKAKGKKFSEPYRHPGQAASSATTKKTFNGLCTSYLSKLPEEMPLVRGYVRKSSFRVATCSTPAIMVGPGTGIAPLRAFLQQRDQERLQSFTQQLQQSAKKANANTAADSKEADESTAGGGGGGSETFEVNPLAFRQGSNLANASMMASMEKPVFAETLLYFGCRREDHDFIYRKDLETFLERGSLTRLRTAFSRSPTLPKKYVQDLIREDGEHIWKMISEGGAQVLVCGDASQMAPDVHKAIAEIIQRYGSKSSTEAEELIKEMKRESRRYQEDVWISSSSVVS